MLASIGIVKGQAFSPDTRTREILDRAAKTGYKMSRVVGFEGSVSGRSFRQYADRQCSILSRTARPLIRVARSI